MEPNIMDGVEIPDKILEKIKKLYNKSLSSKSIGSLEEAEAFMSKVQQLLAEYNLEMSLLEDKGDKTNITEKEFGYNGQVSYGLWEVHIMIAIAKYNWCRCFYNTYTKKITVIGRGDNIGVCKYLYNFITINLIGLSKKSYYEKVEEYNNAYSKEYGYNVKDRMGAAKFEEHLHKSKYIPYRRYYIRDYLAGAVKGIEYKLAEQQYRNNTVTGLVLSNKEALATYVAENHPDLETVKRKENKRGMGYSEGFEDARNLKIGEALTGKEEDTKYIR